MKTLSLALAVTMISVAPATSVLAQTRAQAIELPQNTGAHTIFGTLQVDSPIHSFSSISSSVGSAYAQADVAAGRVSGISNVALYTLDEFAAGAFQARAQGASVERLTFDSVYCVGAVCADATTLGISSVGIDFTVQVSGGVTASVLDPRFTEAQSGIAYGWRFDGRTSAVGGGETAADSRLGRTGSLESQSGTVIVQPGDIAELKLQFETFAGGRLVGFASSGFGAESAVAEADFSHTLKWGGVTGFQAFDINGAPIVLTPGGRFSLLDGQGNDFWFGADSFGAAVPEPATWAMMIVGFGLAGSAIRRRERVMKVQGAT